MEENKNDVAVLEPPHEIEEASSVEDTSTVPTPEAADSEEISEDVVVEVEDTSRSVQEVLDQADASIAQGEEAPEEMDKETQALLDAANEIAENPDEFIPVLESELAEEVQDSVDTIEKQAEEVVQQVEAIEEKLPEVKKSLFNRAIRKIKSWFTR